MTDLSHLQHLSRREFLRRSVTSAGALAALSLAPGAPGVAEASGRHCLWGAYVDGKGGTTIDGIKAFEHAIRRPLGMTRHYLLWDRDLVNDVIEWSAGTGHVPLIAWQGIRVDGGFVKWDQIARGAYDARIHAQAQALAAWGRRAYFVFNHEPENDHPSGGHQEFKAAYKRIHRIFLAEGCTNLKFVATLLHGTYSGARGGAGAWMPDFVDACGVDGYNRGACTPAGWVSFRQLFGDAHAFAKRNHLGMVVEEWGSVEASACGGVRHHSKAGWIRSAGSTIREWSNLWAVVYSNTRAFYFAKGKVVDFRADTSHKALKAFREVGDQPFLS